MSTPHNAPISRDELHARYAEHGITLNIQPKPVKNINFRLRTGTLHISYPTRIAVAQLHNAILARLDWAAAHHAGRQAQSAPSTPTLWGQPIDATSAHHDITALYRQQMSHILPTLIAECQPICALLGVTPSTVLLKKMRTRWGSCNTQARRIWLSIYLAAHPYECSRYVYIHELCHLVHADHSPAFWSLVERCLPDYRRWHQMLRGG